jgi:hypothetical protein
MPLYRQVEAGAQLTPIYPGQQFTLFNGTETPGTGVKSCAFMRAQAPDSLTPTPRLFVVTFPSSATATVLVEASNDDVEAHYQTVGTMGFAGVTTPGYYADAGMFRFYRGNLSAYTSGGMPTMTVQG